MVTPTSVWARVAQFAAMSMLALITLLGTALWKGGLEAHETIPAIATVSVSPELFEMDIRLNAEALVAGIDLSTFGDTNDAPEAAAYDALRAQSAEEFAATLEAAWPELREGFLLTGAGPLEFVEAEVLDPGNIDLVRETALRLSAPMEPGAEGVTVGWVAENGILVIRQTRGEDVYAELLEDGSVTALLPVTGVAQESAGETFLRFVIEGFEHIVPKGLDHILFVLGLFFFALSWSPILWQVTAFTVAHTATLALATLGVIGIPDDWMWLVEAFIALSITWVAVENILQPRMGWLRPAVVFAFGLLHGLGFASVLGDLGLAQGQFVLSLVAFNIGVEIGQLAVIVAAFLLLLIAVQAARMARLDDPEEAMVRDLPEMYRANAIMGSLVIGAIGLYWFVERAFL